jgi:hypothetical protein
VGEWRTDRPTDRPNNELHNEEEAVDGQKGQSRMDWTGHGCWDFQLWIEGRKFGAYWQNNEGHVSLISVLIIPMVLNQIYIPSNFQNPTMVFVNNAQYVRGICHVATKFHGIIIYTQISIFLS